MKGQVLGTEKNNFLPHACGPRAAKRSAHKDVQTADLLRVEGKSAVVEFWRQWFARNPDAVFETEEMIVSDDRAVVRWVYRKTHNGQPWHLRGVDVFTVREGKVAAKLAYVKG